MNARKSRARRANRILLAAPAALAGPLRTSLAPVLLAALLALSLAHASRAEAFVYWADGPQKPGSTIGRANLDGTGADRRFIRAGFGSPPSWVAVDAEHVYWGTIDGTIGRANLDGTGVDPSFIAGSGLPSGVGGRRRAHLLGQRPNSDPGAGRHDRARQPGRHWRRAELYHRPG
jgi:hypothetical protein